MENENKAGRVPDFKGQIEVAAWVNQTKDGVNYLSVKMGGITVNLFKNTPKPKPKPAPVNNGGLFV